MPRAHHVALFAIALVVGCTADDIVARARRLDGAVPVRDAQGVDASLPSYCEGEGPPVLVSDRGLPLCSGGLAESTFRFALCTCEGWVSSAPIVADSFASAEGAYSSDRAGRAGSIGSNGRIALNAPVDVSGALWCSDQVHAGAGGPVTVGSDFHANLGLDSSARVDIGRDAFSGGDVRAASLRVGGILTHSAGTVVDVGVPPTLGGERTAPVSIAPPCECGASDLLDVAGLVAAHALDNDDALVGLDPRALDGYSGDTTLTLPCGRLYLERIAGEGDLTIVVTGRTALFVSGDLSFTGRFEVRLEGTGAEIDLFVAGDVGAMRLLRIGDELRPARARLYVGGAGSVSLSEDGLFGGNLYAPRAELVAAGAVEVFGSAFVRRVNASGPLSLHYDVSVLRAADPCPPPTTGGCATCRDCRNQACIAGSCGACTDDSQCCRPLVCVAGRCEAEPF